MKFEPQACAEFPNDNSLLHDGALWVCPWSRAKPRAIVPARGMARLLSARCAPEGARVNVAAVHPTTPEPPAVEVAGLVSIAKPLDATSRAVEVADDSEAQDTLPPPVQRPLVVEDALAAIPAMSESELAAVDDAAVEALEFDEPVTAPKPQVAPRAHVGASSGTLEEAEPPRGQREADSSERWAVLTPRACELREIRGIRELSLGAGNTPPQVELSAEEFEARPQAAAHEESSAPALPAPPKPARPFVVPRPSDLMADPPPEVRLSANLMSPLPPGVAATAQSEATSTSARVLSEICDDPFVRELQALVADLDTADHSNAQEPLKDLELELTPAPPAALQRAEAWTRLVGGLAQFALECGATRAAALLPRVLQGAPSRVDRLPESTRLALAESGYIDEPTAPLLGRAFSSDAARYRAQFLAGEVDEDEYRYWLAGFLRAYCSLEGDLEDSLNSLEGAGLTRLLRAA